MYENIRTMNKTKNRIHEKTLRIVYQDDTSTFKGLLNADDSVIYEFVDFSY